MEYGTAVLQVNLPDNPTVELHYMVPLDPDTLQPLPTASTILFRAPHLNEDKLTIHKIGVPLDAQFFAREYGWTAFTLAIAAPHEGLGSPNYYIYPESGWFEVVLEVKKWLQKKYNLAPRRMVILGESSGGSMAAQMVATYPEEIGAAAWNGGTIYADLPKDCPVALLGFNAWGCFGGRDTWELVRQSTSQGTQVLWEEGPPIWEPFDKSHHGASTISTTLRRLFLKAVVELSDDEGKVPPPATWPVEATTPNGQSLRFPSEEFFHEWRRLPLELNAAVRRRATTGYVAANEAIEEPSRCFVLFCPPMDDVLLRDCVYALTRENLAVWVVFCGETVSQATEDGAAVLAAIHKAPQLSSLPVTLIGFAEGAPAIFQLLGKKNDTNIDQVLLCDPSWDTEEATTPHFSPDGQFRGLPVHSYLSPEKPTPELPNLPVTRLEAKEERVNPILSFFREYAATFHKDEPQP